MISYFDDVWKEFTGELDAVLHQYKYNDRWSFVLQNDAVWKEFEGEFADLLCQCNSVTMQHCNIVRLTM